MKAQEGIRSRIYEEGMKRDKVEERSRGNKEGAEDGMTWQFLENLDCMEREKRNKVNGLERKVLELLGEKEKMLRKKETERERERKRSGRKREIKEKKEELRKIRNELKNMKVNEETRE